MSRKVIIIRHAKAQGGRHDRHLFPREGAPLSEEGKANAIKLKRQLTRLGVDVPNEPVAVSELLRTKQTAQLAGFKKLQAYGVLNEVNTGLNSRELDKLIAAKAVPEKALTMARRLLRNPPKESIWVTHGMLIAALAEELGISKDSLYIPEMASATEVVIPEK